MFLIFGQNFYAQNYNLTNTFTTNDGLPSNLVYETVLDNDGFLWVATDNGISRFDGKRFINYSTKDGLPSNDVIQVFKQNDGTIWANCYKQPPSYFDKKRNRFVCLEYDKNDLKMSNSLISSIYSINKNDVFFRNYLGKFTFSKGKIINYEQYHQENLNVFKLYLKNKLVTLKNSDSTHLKKKYIVTKFFENNNYLGKILYKNSELFITEYHNNKSIYRLAKNSITRTSIKNLEPFESETNIVTVPNAIKWFKFSSDKLSITCVNGTVYIYDEKSLKLRSTIENDLNINTAYVDQQNNVWLSTLNNGLMYYTKQNIKKEIYSKETVSNFLCAKVDETGNLYAGNYQGEIYLKKGNKETKYNFSTLKENNIWIRNIYFFPKKTIIVSDNGLLINFNKKLTFNDDTGGKHSIKSSTKINDKVLILGSIQGLIKFNVVSETHEILKFSKERILNLKKIDDTSFYFSANAGLFRYDLTTNTSQLILENSLFKNDKIQYFENTSDSQMWVSTYKGNLYYFENNTIKKEFIDDQRIPNNISKLLNIDHQLWMASKSGIYILNYADLKNVSISKLTTSDGLTSNVVNFLMEKKDTIYAATDNGVSKIPLRQIRSNYEIKPHLIAVKINGKVVSLRSNYQLKSNENNISLELAGVDITGHFKNFQYAINKNEFLDIEGKFLNLQLNNGMNTIVIRVIDENNKIHADHLQLTFEIDTPFYQRIWFWSFITLIVSTLLYMYFNRRKLEKQKIIFDKHLALEHQQKKITADLHDDLGASLSSLQINSAVAQKLFDKNPLEAKKILVKIESQAKQISENIGDIIWSLKPSKDEFMSLSTRIKKITSEILGSSDIHYGLLLDPSIDAEITDFSARKNIILICKEALNNILKHSQAKEVCVLLQKRKDFYFLEIEDDGIGFSDEMKKGNGVANMKRRAEELGGTFEIKHENGCKLIFFIPRFRG